MIGSRSTLGATTPDPADLAAVEVEPQSYAAPVRPTTPPRRVIQPREKKKARSGIPVETEHYFDTADGRLKPKKPQPEPERQIAPQRYVAPSYFQYTPDYHD